MIQAGRERLYTLLRWSEQYTRLDMVYLAKGGFWQTFGQAGSAILSFVLVIAFANLLPKETYGLYKYILSLAGLLNIFTLTGMNQAVGQAVATGNEGALRTSITYQLRWNTLATIAFLVAAGYYFVNDNFVLGSSLLILSVCWPMTATFNTYSAYLNAKKEFALNNFYSVIATAIYVVGTIAAIMLSGEVVWLVAAYGLTTFFANYLLYRLTLKQFKPPQASAGGALQFGRHLTFINVIGTVVSQIDSILLHHFWGSAQLATYSVAMSIPNRAVPFFKSAIETSYPKLAEKSPAEINSVLHRRVFWGLGAGCVVAVAYVFTAPFIFSYLLPQYVDAVVYTQILSIGFVFALPNRYMTLVFTAQKMSWAIFVNNLAQGILRLVLYVLLGIWLGILGLVIVQAVFPGLSLLLQLGMWRYTSANA